MKKIIISIIIGILVLLSACDSAIVAGSVSQEVANCKPSEEIQPMEPSENITLEFSSVEEMVRAFNSAQNISAVNMTGFDAAELNALQSVAEVEVIENGLPIPMYDGSELPLRNVNNLSNILIEATSTFGMPVIWYYAELDGSDVIISTGLLSDEQIDQIGTGGIGAWKEIQEEILSTLPSDPNGDEVTVTSNPAQIAIGEENISSIITQYSTDPRCHIEFILNDELYVKIYIYPEDLDRGILEGLSFDAITVQ